MTIDTLYYYSNLVLQWSNFKSSAMVTHQQNHHTLQKAGSQSPRTIIGLPKFTEELIAAKNLVPIFKISNKEFAD